MPTGVWNEVPQLLPHEKLQHCIPHLLLVHRNEQKWRKDMRGSKMVVLTVWQWKFGKFMTFHCHLRSAGWRGQCDISEVDLDNSLTFQHVSCVCDRLDIWNVFVCFSTKKNKKLVHPHAQPHVFPNPFDYRAQKGWNQNIWKVYIILYYLGFTESFEWINSFIQAKCMLVFGLCKFSV